MHFDKILRCSSIEAKLSEVISMTQEDIPKPTDASTMPNW